MSQKRTLPETELKAPKRAKLSRTTQSGSLPALQKKKSGRNLDEASEGTSAGTQRQEQRKFSPSVEKEISTNVSSEAASTTFPADALIPSKTSDRNWITASSATAGRSGNVPKIQYSADIDVKKLTVIESSVGKWMLFCSKVNTSEDSKGLVEHDQAWLAIKQLVESGQDTGIMSAKCSTAHPGHATSRKGLICIYTSNFADKALAKKAADSIRQAYKYVPPMYYKTDNDTYAGKYIRLGHSNVSIYKHTPDNQMYERDPDVPKTWNLLQF